MFNTEALSFGTQSDGVEKIRPVQWISFAARVSERRAAGRFIFSGNQFAVVRVARAGVDSMGSARPVGKVGISQWLAGGHGILPDFIRLVAADSVSGVWGCCMAGVKRGVGSILRTLVRTLPVFFAKAQTAGENKGRATRFCGGLANAYRPTARNVGVPLCGGLGGDGNGSGSGAHRLSDHHARSTAVSVAPPDSNCFRYRSLWRVVFSRLVFGFTGGRGGPGAMSENCCDWMLIQVLPVLVAVASPPRLIIRGENRLSRATKRSVARKSESPSYSRRFRNA